MTEIKIDEKKTQWKGPRNLPKKSKKQINRLRIKAAHKANRGVYSGQ